MQAWADTFTLIAPDTPGYGLSDPLSRQVEGSHFTLSDFAHALAGFADAIGLHQFGVYGHHTGAMIAAEFARLYPKRTTVTIANGYLVLPEEERQDILDNYFADFTPQPDGRHLAHMWRRIRDQFLFFPWAVQTAEARSRVRTKLTIPPPDVIQDDFLDLMRTGIHESDGYGAAFRCDGTGILRDLTSECLVTAHKGDLLYEQLNRLPSDLPEVVSVERFDTLDRLNTKAKTLLKEQAKGDAPAITATATITGQPWKSYADTRNGQLFLRLSHVGSGLPVVLIHNLGSSTLRWQPVMNALLGKKPFFAFGLPGHGETQDAWGDREVTIQACATAIDEAMTNLGIDQCHVVSCGGGGLVALDLLHQTEAEVRSWTAIDFWLFDEKEKQKLKNSIAPPLTPQPLGQHLTEAWYMIRDAELFWPWFEPKPENALKHAPETDPEKLHSRVVDLLQASPAYNSVVRSAFKLDSKTMLAGLTVPVTFSSRDGSPHMARCQRAAELTPQGSQITLSKDDARQAAALVALLRE